MGLLGSDLRGSCGSDQLVKGLTSGDFDRQSGLPSVRHLPGSSKKALTSGGTYRKVS